MKSGACRTNDHDKGNYDEKWGLDFESCEKKCLFSLRCTGFEFYQGRCKRHRGPILSTVPLDGSVCYKKAPKEALEPNRG